MPARAYVCRQSDHGVPLRGGPTPNVAVYVYLARADAARMGTRQSRRLPRISGGFAASLQMARRFPPPWSVEETDACFIVKDHNGQALAYVYFEDDGWHAKIAGRDASESVCLSAVGPLEYRSGVGPTPIVGRARPGTRPRGRYGDKAKPSALRQRNRRLCCESANDNPPLPAASDD